MNRLAPAHHRAPGAALRAAVNLGDLAYDALRIRTENLLEGAVARTGLSDFGDAAFLDGLKRVVVSANEDAQLNVLGRIDLRMAIQTALAARLRQVDAMHANPDALEHKPRRPILIAAPPRCGTTLLQRLLAAHPDAMSLPFWLAIDPFPAPSETEWRSGGGGWRRMRAVLAAHAMHLLMPAMRSVHDTRADLAVECTWLMLPAFQSVQWMSTWPLHSYREWLLGQTARSAYQWLYRGLQVLQHPLPGSHWVLKAPGHFCALPAVLDTFDDALVVQLHRDPAVFVSSMASLVSIPHHLHSHDPQFERTVEGCTTALARGADDAVAARRTHPDRFCDIAFEDLAADPLAAAARVCRQAGLRWDDEVRKSLVGYLRQHPRNRHGRHRYPLDAWGLDPDAVRDRFRSYIDHFDIATGRANTSRWSDR